MLERTTIYFELFSEMEMQNDNKLIILNCLSQFKDGDSVKGNNAIMDFLWKSTIYLLPIVFRDGDSVKEKNTIVDSFHLSFTHTEFRVNGVQVRYS